MRFYRLAIIATHPIQYQVPWFRALARRPEIDLQVFFCHSATAKEQSSAGFGVEFEWDVPLLEGYSHQFLHNVAKHPSIGTFNGLDTPEIKRIITRGKYDAVLISGWNFKSAWQTIQACREASIPVMVRGDSHLYTPRHPLKSALKYPFYRRFISKFDACLAVGKWSSKYYQYYGASTERIFFVPHVIDYDFFARQVEHLLPQRNALRERWNLDKNAVVFTFVGKFIDVKRPMDFIRSIDLAAQQNSLIRGLMVGDGALHLECRELTQRSGIPVEFTGFLNQSQIAQAFVAADILILPSTAETWGLVVNEAMACGRACIVSDQVGCGPDLIVPGQTGATFPMGNITALSEVILSCAANRTSLQLMGENARQHLKNKYSMDVAVNGVLQAIEAIQAGS